MSPSTDAPDRRPPFWRLGIALGILGGVLGFTWATHRAASFQAQDVGLGRNTLPTVAFDEGRQISGPFEDMEVVLETFADLQAAGRPLILWIGASQLYAINQPEEGDQLAVWYATQSARARGSRYAYVMAANPNCNQTELFATYMIFRQAGLRPDALVVGFTYDDLKEPGVRQLALDHLRPLDAGERVLGGAAAEHIAEARAALEGTGPAASAVERNAVDGTPQERLELELVARLEDHWDAYARRGQLQAAAIAAWKVPFTGLVFQVFTRPKRLVPPALQEWNEAGLEALFDVAAEDGVPTFVYQAPHRPADDDASFYHDRAAYDSYHSELEARLTARAIPYLDLELLVEQSLWGRTNDGSPDVFHFRDEGHRLLGEAVDAWLAQHGL